MSKYQNEPWMEKDGSILTVQPHSLKSEFGANKTEYKVHGYVAFNVGRDTALHIVEVHNRYLEQK